MWDHRKWQLKIPREEAVAMFMPHLIPQDQGIALVTEKLKANKPFSFIRIGDVDALYMSFMKTNLPVKDYMEILPRLNFWVGGIDIKRLPDPEEYAHVVEKADIVCCQGPWSSRDESVLYWGPALDMLVKWDLLTKKKYYEMHIIFKMMSDGLLFQLLRGKRVVLVGNKAEPFLNYYFNHPHYRQAFPFLGLEHIEIVGAVPTPPINIMNHRQEIERAVRAMYKTKPDLFLLSASMLSKYLAVMVRDDGYTGIDIGNGLESIMNWPMKRPFMEVFQNYEHPDYEFLFHAEKAFFHTGVIPRSSLGN